MAATCIQLDFIGKVKAVPKLTINWLCECFDSNATGTGQVVIPDNSDTFANQEPCINTINANAESKIQKLYLFCHIIMEWQGLYWLVEVVQNGVVF